MATEDKTERKCLKYHLQGTCMYAIKYRHLILSLSLTHTHTHTYTHTHTCTRTHTHTHTHTHTRTHTPIPIIQTPINSLGRARVQLYLAPHSRYFIREMRIKAYAQLLESNRSLSLSHMATSFGVSVEFMDRELSKFIASGRLHCRIDKVCGIVETNRPDSKYIRCGCVVV